MSQVSSEASARAAIKYMGTYACHTEYATSPNEMVKVFHTICWGPNHAPIEDNAWFPVYVYAQELFSYNCPEDSYWSAQNVFDQLRIITMQELNIPVPSDGLGWDFENSPLKKDSFNYV